MTPEKHNITRLDITMGKGVEKVIYNDIVMCYNKPKWYKMLWWNFTSFVIDAMYLLGFATAFTMVTQAEAVAELIIYLMES